MDSIIFVFDYTVYDVTPKQADKVFIQKDRVFKSFCKAFNVPCRIDMRIDINDYEISSSKRYMVSIQKEQHLIFPFMSALFAFAQFHQFTLINQSFYPKKL